MGLRQRLWLCVPPLLMYNLDVGLTLAGQNEAYWQGNYSSPDELNPLAHFLLATHPYVFVAVALLWEVVFCGLILWLRPRLAVPVALVLAVGHAYGASTWMLYWGFAGVPAVALHLLAAALIVVCWACGSVPLSARQGAPSPPPSPPRTPESAT